MDKITRLKEIEIPEISSLLFSRDEKISLCLVEKPNLLTLMNLKTGEGDQTRDIKIIQRSAAHFREIGTRLLNDRYGERVDIIDNDKRGKAKAIMLTVYQEWMAEDPNCSWVTLIDCFGQCGLHRLATSLEQHFQLPSSGQPDSEGTYYDIHIHTHENVISTLYITHRDSG